MPLRRAMLTSKVSSTTTSLGSAIWKTCGLVSSSPISNSTGRTPCHASFSAALIRCTTWRTSCCSMKVIARCGMNRLCAEPPMRRSTIG